MLEHIYYVNGLVAIGICLILLLTILPMIGKKGLFPKVYVVGVVAAILRLFNVI